MVTFLNRLIKIQIPQILVKQFVIYAVALNEASGIFLTFTFEYILVEYRVETKHKIAQNLALIARKFTRFTKIEIKNA